MEENRTATAINGTGNTVRSRVNAVFTTDRLKLIDEINDMIVQEVEKLDEHDRQLSQILTLDGITKADKEIIRSNKHDVEEAVFALNWLTAFVKDESIGDEKAFTEILKIGNYVFRKSVAARTSMLRHTPTLKGLPIALQPSQNHFLSSKQHTVDYARGGYILFQQPDKEPKTLFQDQPELKKIAEEIKAKLYGETPGVDAILFTCGLGAVNTLTDYLRSLSRLSGRKNYLGENCWLELRKHVLESNDPAFVFFDETDKKKIIELIHDENVQSIFLEGIQNFATMRATDIGQILSEVCKIDFKKPKFLVLDHVVTFDSNIFENISGELPKNFCLAAFVSGIKFFQAGFDIGKSGILFLKYDKKYFAKDADPYQRIVEIRAGSGRVLSIEEAHLSNIDTAKSLKSRMARYDRNMKTMALQLDKAFSSNGLGRVYSAWLPAHADHETALQNYSTGGRMLYLKLDEKRFPEEKLLKLYSHLANHACAEGLPIMAASNFGFCTPHIHTVRQAGVGLSLRISAGSTDGVTVEKICDFLTDNIEAFA